MVYNSLYVDVLAKCIPQSTRFFFNESQAAPWDGGRRGVRCFRAQVERGEANNMGSATSDCFREGFACQSRK